MYYPEKNRKQLQEKLQQLTDSQYMVVCYCAAWCRTCNGFAEQLDALAKHYPQHIFVWVDVEEHEELLIDEDIEDFPTILVQNKKGTLFYGPLLPYAEHIERVLQQTPTPQPLTSATDFAQLMAAAS